MKHSFGLKNILSMAFLLAGLTLTCSSPVRAEDFTFADLKDVEFVFASGVGGWSTELKIAEDGTFSGYFHDSEMGLSGDDYPYGTVYVCDFSGSFSGPEKVDDHTYTFYIEDMSQERNMDEEEIRDGIRYVYSFPYGLDNAIDFYLYLPGTPLDELPEEFVSWGRGTVLYEEGYTALPSYGLYNANMEEGFFGYTDTAQELYSDDSYMDGLIRDAAEKAAEIEEEINRGDLPQQQMNLKARDLYTVWDDCLNEIWAYLKQILDPETMDALTQEELQWINEKETKADQAGKEFEGGSLQPFIEQTTAADMTEKRVYELGQRYPLGGN